MDSSAEYPTSELESFREQWRREVQERNVGAQALPGPRDPDSALASSSRPARYSGPPKKVPQPAGHAGQDRDEAYVAAPSFEGLEAGATPGPGKPDTHGQHGGSAGPVSALEHYEKAVERETSGSLGDSLQLYRKAFRMDSQVDQKYKAKHFPPPMASSSSQGVSSDSASATPHALLPRPADTAPPSMKDLIASFAAATLEPVAPEIEGMPQPRCALAEIPDEILVYILRDVAIADVGDFVRLSQVCKRLAFLVATEDRIWRRICLGREFGFGGMHYEWQLGVLWGPPEHGEGTLGGADAGDADADDAATATNSPAPTRDAQAEHATSAARTLLLHGTLYSSSWQRMFRLRPRVRFNGCYISTVNYMRAGQSGAHQVTWSSSPVHIVTYYRYLRFFRDGSLVSLLTTAEPPDVVPHLTRDALALHRASPAAHLPSAVMQSALKGRWRLSSAADHPDKSLSEVEGDVYVETEGVGKYIYRMELSLRTAGRGARHNKLAWRGFYTYDRLTDDWGEFGLKHYKNFFFSRVKSYGIGIGIGE